MDKQGFLDDEDCSVAHEHRLPGEGAILWSSSEGQVVNAIWIACGLLFFWLIIPFVIMVFKAIETYNHQYTLTKHRLREYSGVFSRQVDELELYRVKDIAVFQPLIQRIFGRGNITLITSDRTSPTVLLSAVPNPLAVADAIRHFVEQCRLDKGVREID